MLEQMLTIGNSAQYGTIQNVIQATLSGEMRASLLHPDGRLTLERRPIPQVVAGDVLVRVAAVGICGSDAHYVRHGRIGDFVVRSPLVLGHEASGRIVAVGEGVAVERIGERVSIEPQRPDPYSAESLRGEYNLCPRMRFFGTPPVDGALAEYVSIGAAFAHPVPHAVTDAAAAMIEPLSVGMAAIKKAAVDLGGSVFIAGAGPIGLMCTQVARASGLARIVVSDPDQTRRHLAGKFGATATVDPGEDGAQFHHSFDAFIDASGAVPAILGGLRLVRPGGRVVLVGMGADEVALPIPLIQERELVITGVFRYANTWPAAISLVATGQVDLDAMVTAEYALSDVRAALDADRVPGSIKAVVYPGWDDGRQTVREPLVNAKRRSCEHVRAD